jgi:hypothetical protein
MMLGYGEGDLVARLAKCTACKSQWFVPEGTIKSSAAPGGSLPMESLIALTFPQLTEVYADRLALEETVRSAPLSLSDEVRRKLIAEPFQILDNDFAMDAWRHSVGKFFGSLALIAAILCGFPTVISFFGPITYVNFLGVLLTAGLGWVCHILMASDVKRLLKTSLYPRLASSLAPLRPTPEELKSVLAGLKSETASHTRLKEFLPLLEGVRVPEPVHISTSSGDR